MSWVKVIGIAESRRAAAARPKVIFKAAEIETD